MPSAGRAYRGADLAVLRSHAVSVMQVCKGLGRPPRTPGTGSCGQKPSSSLRQGCVEA